MKEESIIPTHNIKTTADHTFFRRNNAEMNLFAFLVVAAVTLPALASNPDGNCFSGDALVSMADGTLMPMSDVNVGDVVLTGTGIGQGLVTYKLENPVLGRNARDVIVATTATGELIGTGNHPVLLNGKWQLLGDVASLGDIPPVWSSFMLKIEHKKRVVDVWYDLQIDGHVDDHASSHSYVVNGVVAFGKLLKNFDFGTTESKSMLRGSRTSVLIQ
jgi:hypothetical protein